MFLKQDLLSDDLLDTLFLRKEHSDGASVVFTTWGAFQRTFLGALEKPLWRFGYAGCFFCWIKKHTVTRKKIWSIMDNG